jgi:hypothetical protein
MGILINVNPYQNTVVYFNNFLSIKNEFLVKTENFENTIDNSSFCLYNHTHRNILESIYVYYTLVFKLS